MLISVAPPPTLKELEACSPGLTHPKRGYPGETVKKYFINPERVESNVTFIELNLVTFEELPEFVLERDLAMMFLLRRNICSDIFELRKTDGKRAITVLPRKIVKA